MEELKMSELKTEIDASDLYFPEDLTPAEIREKLDKQGFKPEFRPSSSLGEPTSSTSFNGRKTKIFYPPILIENRKIHWHQRSLSDEEYWSIIPKDLGEKEKENLYLMGIELVEGEWFRWVKQDFTTQIQSPEALPMPTKEEFPAVTYKKATEFPDPPLSDSIRENLESLATLGFFNNPAPRVKQQIDNPNKIPFEKIDRSELNSKLRSLLALELQKPEVKELAELMGKSGHLPIDKLDLEWGEKTVIDILLLKTDISSRRVQGIAKEISDTILFGIQKRKFPNPVSFLYTSLSEPFGLDMALYYNKCQETLNQANQALKKLEENLKIPETKQNV